MANWKEVTERWLPIVENMEEHSMDDYAIPEIYRAAEKAIDELLESLEATPDDAEDGMDPHITGASAPESLEALEAAQVWLKRDGVCPYVVKHQVAEAIRKHKGD